MKIRFCAAQTYGLNPKEKYADVYAEFDVEKAPTKAQCEGIQEYLNDRAEEWLEKTLDGDAAYYDLCRRACAKNGVKVIANRVVKTFYV